MQQNSMPSTGRVWDYELSAIDVLDVVPGKDGKVAAVVRAVGSPDYVVMRKGSDRPLRITSDRRKARDCAEAYADPVRFARKIAQWARTREVFLQLGVM